MTDSPDSSHDIVRTPGTGTGTDPGSGAERSIRSVLVANRGEIARRVIATCARRGLGTVAVFSDADADAPHVAEADTAVRLPGEAPGETYLRGDLIVAAAQRAGADAIHPGYGFLSEDAGFARAVEAAGLTWIGPPPEAIEVMGSKIASKEAMRAAGVPVLDRLDPENVDESQLPVLVKASAGGGGRGMRIVRTLADLPEAIASASREAASAFGDPAVFCERYLETGHHVEVQVMADQHGTVWALGERECSLQRRHQKVVEEAPSPLVTRVGGDMRERILAAARTAAAAVGYVGAGTVELLATEDGDFSFLEMNTRLQVEHPVTECVTGTDLVALQLAMAQGERLTGPEPVATGWSVEARIYAEDPLDDWRPQTGTLELVDIPGVDTRFTVPPEHGIRLDSGVETGSVVGTRYDAMLAKVVSRAPTRTEAVRELAAAVRRARVHGVTTNQDLLVSTLTHPEVVAGTADTGFYDRNPPAALTRGTGLDPWLAAVAAAADAARTAQAGRAPVPGVRTGFRNVVALPQRRRYRLGERELEVAYRQERDGWVLVAPVDDGGAQGNEGVDGTQTAQATQDTGAAAALPRLVRAEPGLVVLEVDGVQKRLRVHPLAGATSADGSTHARVAVTGAEGSCTLAEVPRFVDPSRLAPAGALVAPMPGTVVAVHVALGDDVVAGQPLLTLEAMKMEHTVSATVAGRVEALSAAAGETVDQGATLVVIDEQTDQQTDEQQEDEPA